MQGVDAFLQFISEELGKEGTDLVEIHAPTPVHSQWKALAQFRSRTVVTSGKSLSAALNQMSQAVDFTYKDLQVEDEPSVVKRAAELLGDRGPLFVAPPTTNHLWEVGGSNEKLRAFTMEEALRLLIEILTEQVNE